MSIKNKLISCLCFIAITSVSYVAIWLQSNRISKLQAQIKELEEDALSYKNMYTRLQEDVSRQNISIIELMNLQTRSQREHAKRIQIMENSEDACDWLDDDLPDSIRMLFNPGCKDE